MSDEKKQETGDASTSLKARDNWARFNEADRGGHRSFVKRAKQANDFYAGNQWNKEDKERLDREGRPALTLNMILSTVNAMIGEQLERKIEGVFRPKDTGDENTAFALNKITRAILDSNAFDDVEEMVFADGIITGRGFFDVRLSFKRNIQGEVEISSDDPIDIIIDPEAKEMDPCTWSEVFVSRWMTPDEIGEEYGWDKQEDLHLLAEGGSHNHDDNFDYFDQTFGGEAQDLSQAGEANKLRRVRVIERQHFVVTKQYFWVDPETGAMRPVPFGVDKETAEEIAEINGHILHRRKGRRVRVTTSADDVLLHDDWSIYRSFTVVPFFPYFRRGNPFGVVENLIDPQNLLNKTSSQELHIVNTTANSGWVMQEDSLVDMDADELAERGAETGLVLQYKRGYEKPDKISPNSIPTGIDRISQKAASTIREISAVNASMMGAARADQSGRAQEASIARGQVQVSVVLNNLKRARLAVLRKILELVQDFYTETRYFSVIGDGIMDDGVNTSVGINQPDEEGNLINDVTLGEYTTDVTFRPNGGTLADKEFEEAIRLREMGIAIPDHVVVGYSNLTKRGEVAEFLKNSQGFGEQSEEEKELQELQITHQIEMVRRELEEADAKIEVLRATAAEKMSKAESLEDYKQVKIELQKMEDARVLKERELSLRIALAARSHQNQSQMNDTRITSQMAMKSMDMIAAESKVKSTEKPTHTKSKEA